MTSKEYHQVVLAKVLLCGAFAVGKTSLVLRYVDGVFSTDTIQTLGANFLKKSLEHKGPNNELYKVDMQLWDLSGTIRTAESISRTFFMGTSGVLFVHDLTRNWTLNEIPSWYKSVKAVSPHFIPIIVGNKADLEKKRETTAAYITETYIKCRSNTGTHLQRKKQKFHKFRFLRTFEA